MKGGNFLHKKTFFVIILLFLVAIVSSIPITIPFSLGGDATAVFLTDAANRNDAKCLDGSPGAFYFRPGQDEGKSKFYIHHEGGGWCNSLHDCYDRAQTDLGSSKKYPAQANLGGGYFSTDPKVNPMMYNWNAVYLKYCDGGSFTGDNSSVTTYGSQRLYFRGKRILQAMWEELKKFGIQQAKEVVVSGCSAGGLATFLHLDWWRSVLDSATKVVGLPDSGFFLDFDFQPKYETQLKWVFEQMNSTGGINQKCIQHHVPTKDTWKCIFAQHVSPFISTPIWPLQSVFDSWQTANVLGSKDPSLINEFGKNLTTLLKNNLLGPGQGNNGVFLDSCFHHCGEWGSIVIDGLNQAEAFQQWYEGRGQKVYIQNQPYPCDQCCKGK